MSFFNDEFDLVDDDQYDLLTATLQIRRRQELSRAGPGTGGQACAKLKSIKGGSNKTGGKLGQC